MRWRQQLITLFFCVHPRDLREFDLEFETQNQTDVIELDPGYESVYSNLAICYQKSGDSEKALYVIDRLLARNPNQGHGYAIKGWILESKDLDDEAEVYYNKAEANGYQVYEEEVQ